MAFTVVYDACVLYPAPLRDLLLRLAMTSVVRARWSEAILDECFRSILEQRPDLNESALARTRELMTRAIPDCLVDDFHELIDGLALPDPNDRHVLAAAIRAGAQAIVTFNLEGMTRPASAGASPSTEFDANDRSRDSGTVSHPSPDASPFAGFDANDGSADAEAPSGETSRPIECGERWMHDTTVHGQADTFRLYGCTARAESGRETVYAFRSPDACRVSARLSELHTDLDLFVLSDADALSCQKASSTPLDLQHGEQLIFDAAAKSTHLIVVDGYARSVGSYTIELDCVCGAASASFDDGAWRLEVDRRWNGDPARVDAPASELADNDYQPVSNAAAHDLFVSDSWRQVSIGTAPWLGAVVKGTRGSLRYELATGTFAGGRFVVWSSARGLEAELTLYGSGVPIVSSERGRLVRKAF